LYDKHLEELRQQAQLPPKGPNQEGGAAVTKKLQALRAQIQADPQRRERVKQYERAIETALALGRLREARAMTQRELADRMAVSQANISRIEREEDIYLSTLRTYIENLGGHLEINAVFPDTTITIGTHDLRIQTTVAAS
jgi:ribosome-binding protein aMBF1 (putative translation factor)